MTSKSQPEVGHPITDEYLQWDRLVIVCAQHGEKFLGWVPPHNELEEMGCESPKDYLRRHMLNGSPAELRDVRILASQLQATPDGRGGIAAIGNLMVLMPVDMFPRGMEKHYVRVSTFYFPSDNEDCRPLVKNLLKDAIQMEARRELQKAKASAAEAGIEVPNLVIAPKGGH